MNHRFFASDNSAPVHPTVMEAVLAANTGHAISYGDDNWTRAALKVMQSHFGKRASCHFVYNGTGANVLGMGAAVSGYHGIICTDVSHLNTDECGAPERVLGAKLLPVPSVDGRMEPEQIPEFLSAKGVEHHNQPRVVSITQSTELGTVYHPEMIREIARVCHRNDLYLHMDGARISNAAASLGVGLNDISGKLGVDILSLGGTKNGMMFGEAVVFFDRALASAFPYIRKQGMQLASKMRFIAAQFSALFGGDLWFELADSANKMARYLESRLTELSDIEVVHPVEANAVFARVPRERTKVAQAERFFYVWDEKESVVRLMSSFDTTEEDVDALVLALQG
jgi:threonine aldolase